MFPDHNPYPALFSWLCSTNNIPGDKHTEAAAAMRRYVTSARQAFYSPLGKKMPYDDGYFRGAYLLAYFPYYIEPVYHALASEKSVFGERPGGVMKAAFLGGGPVPESLGLAAYLRDHAPHISAIEGTVFDREAGWGKVQQELLPLLAPAYLPASGSLSAHHKRCDLAKCGECGESCHSLLEETDFVLSQNFLTEIYGDREVAFRTIRKIIRESRCRTILFVENTYSEVTWFMTDLAARLHQEGITKRVGAPRSMTIRPRFMIPKMLTDNLFVGQDGLIPKRKVNFQYMKLWIQR